MKLKDHGIKFTNEHRICKHSNCKTILSRYNLGEFCAIHEGTMTEREMHRALYGLASAHQEQFIRKPYKLKIPKSTRNLS